ncbi:hypothetical protein C2G38_2189133 [Gigaspora rosea]|uniref:Uncharacterized protein n=1 Tax=Gigaspora rosea TaxID=44941 RepID=A0A397V469_9GLOM|nr:hypothetical protein C2G38_2189133 [Gigaspora rosea]
MVHNYTTRHVKRSLRRQMRRNANSNNNNNNDNNNGNNNNDDNTIESDVEEVIVPDDVEEVVGPDVGPDDVERLLAIHTRLEQLVLRMRRAQYEGDEEAAAFYLEKSVEIGQKIYQLILYMRQQRWWLWRDE